MHSEAIVRYSPLLLIFLVAACASPEKQSNALREAAKATDICLERTAATLAKRSKDPQYVSLKSYDECVEIARSGVRENTSSLDTEMDVIKAIEPRIKDRSYVVASEAISRQMATDGAFHCMIETTIAQSFRFSGRKSVEEVMNGRCYRQITSWLSYHPERVREDMKSALLDVATETAAKAHAKKK